MLKEYLPQPDGFNHAHCGSVAIHNGELFCLWYVYNEEEFKGARLALSQFNSSLKRWSQPRLVLPSQAQSQGNPCLFSFQGELYAFFVLLEGHYWNSARLHIAKVDLPSGTLQDIHKFTADLGLMVRHRPLVLENEIIVPAYDEEKNQTILYKLKPPFKELLKMGALDPGPIQGEILSISGVEVMLVLRPTGEKRFIMRAHSHDQGQSFPFPSYPTPFNCPLSGIAALNDRDGNILVAHNNTEKHQRTPLSLSLSQDGLKSLKKSMVLQFGDGEFSYPSMIMDFGGNLHVIFTNNREKIGHYMLHEDDLKVLKD